MDRKTESQLRQELADLWALLRAERDSYAALRQEAERYRWLAARMLAADFDYGGDGTQALAFEMPKGFMASADCGATIDAAMLIAPAVGAA